MFPRFISLGERAIPDSDPPINNKAGSVSVTRTFPFVMRSNGMDASLYTKFPHTMLYTQHMVFPINKDINSES